MDLKQSTAVTVKIGPFVDSTDGNTDETGLTIAQADVRLSKNGGDFAQKTEATSCTHDELGWYGCPIDATDTATLGRLQLMAHASGALPVWHEFNVISANEYDHKYGSTIQPVNATQIEGSDATDQINAACDTAITDAALATAAALATVDGIVDAILLDTGTTLPAQITGLNNVSAADVNAQCDTAITDAALATAANLATVDTVVDAVKAKTDLIPAAPAAVGDIPTAAAIADATWDEAISGHLGAGTTGNALNAAGSAGDPWATAIPGAYGVGTAGKILGDNINAPIATVDSVVDGIATTLGAAGAGLTALATAANLATVDGIVDAILVDTGTTIPADIAALNDVSAADVNAQCDTAITDAALATAANLATVDTVVDAVKAKTDLIPAAPAAVGDIPTAAAIADATWDEAISGHLGAGTTGNALNAAGSAGDPWATAIPGAYGVGTAGKILGDNINAPIATVDSVVDGIATTLGAAGAGLTALATAANLATVDGIVDAILVDTGTTIPADIAALNDVSAADVNAQCDTAITDAALATAAALATVDTVADAVQVVTDKLATAMELDGAEYRFTTNALEQAPSGGGGGDATAANQVLLLEDIADIKGTGFVKDTNSLTNLSAGDTIDLRMETTVEQD